MQAVKWLEGPELHPTGVKVVGEMLVRGGRPERHALTVYRLPVEAPDVVAHIRESDVALLRGELSLEREHRPGRARVTGELDRVAMLGEDPRAAVDALPVF